MRIALLAALVFAFGCKKDHEAAPVPAPLPAPAGSAVAPTPPPTPADPAALDRVTKEILEYTYQMIPLLAGFDGNCDHQIAAMTKLEPLVDKIRADTLAAGPDVDFRVRQYMQEHKQDVVDAINKQLELAKMSRADLELKDSDVKAKCGTNPKYQAEMNRIGVMKKKT
ncbi:MAG: hypothetical protein ABJE66_28625 [Deltaproteobacteria bacterium]